MTNSTPDVTDAVSTQTFEAFAAAAVEDILVRQPVMASSLGDHRFDGRLDDLRPAALDEERTAIAARSSVRRRS